MKIPALLFLLLSLSACTVNQTGRIVSSAMNEKGENTSVLLSEYFQAKEVIVDGSLTVHLIVTLGKERLPSDYKPVLSWSDRKYRDRIEAVEEVYLTNRTDKEIVVDVLDISYFNSTIGLIEKPITIPPKSFYKTTPRVLTTSLYRAERERNLNIGVDGDLYSVVLTESRTPVNSL